MHDDRPPRTELEALVAACIEAEARGDAALVEHLLAQRPELMVAARAQLDDLRNTGLLDAVPQQIGNYRIVSQIGRGGMGTVYLAEQTEPVQRRVALKLVKAGEQARDIFGRFTLERQSLAMMQHPNIAGVFDAGISADGRPYFVMEYVDGLQITEHADLHRLTTDARLRLFLQVCEGVQHAHLRGIIHRDLKPSNILVAQVDESSVPKIIDFGIAKAIDQRLSPVSMRTEEGVLLGTPEYMSPEQAGGDPHGIDLRTDVYSLGVVLYELLTGTLPFPSERLRTSHAELQRILREEPPTKPSRRATAQPIAEHAAARRTSAAALGRALRGDLDWICLAAMAKERDQRYATVNDLAGDVRRHLAREPVLAGPPSRAYRMHKFVRRNRIQVLAAAAVMVALIAGLVASVASWVRESAARDAAESSFQNALQAVDRMLTQVADALHGAPRMDDLRKKLLEDATELFGRVANTASDDPRARFEAARARVALARMSQAFGRSQAAAAEMSAALAALEELAVVSGGELRYALELAKARGTSGQLLFQSGNALAAFAAADATLADLGRLNEIAPESVELHQAMQSCQQLRGRLLRDRDPKASIAAYEGSLQEGQWLRDAGVRDPELARSLVFVRVDLAGARYMDGDWAGCERELLAARQGIAELGPRDDWDVKRCEVEQDLAHKLALVTFGTGRVEAAIEAGEEAVAAARALVAEHPRVASYRGALATAYGNLARFRAASESGEGVIEAFRAATDMLEDAVRDFPDVPKFRRSLASYSGNVARAYLLQHRASALPPAEPYVQRSLSLFEQRFAQDPNDGKTADDFGITLLNAGYLERAAGRDEAAAGLFTRAIEVVSPLAASDASLPGLTATIADASHALAEIAAARRDWSEARARLESARDAEQRFTRRAPADPSLNEIRPGLVRLEALVAARAGDHVAAAARIENVVSAFEPGTWQGRMAAADVLHACWRASREAEPALAAEYAVHAIARYRDALALIAARLAEKPSIELESHCAAGEIALAELLAAGNDSTAALAMLRKAIDVLRRNRGELHADPFADERLADGLRLAAELGD